MYSPHLFSSLVNVHIDDLRRSRAASRRLAASIPSDRDARAPSANVSGHPVRALAARFAH
jgi:hypothetical protein